MLKEPTDVTTRCRVPRDLLERARRASGVEETSELVRLALARLASEDGFATRFRDQVGTIPADIDLGDAG